MENFLVVPLELLDSRASDMSQGLTPPEVNIVCLDLMGKKNPILASVLVYLLDLLQSRIVKGRQGETKLFLGNVPGNRS